MTEIEKQALLNEVGKQVSDTVKTEISGVTKTVEEIAKKAAEEAAKNGGFISSDTLKEYQEANKIAMQKFEDIAKEQGIALDKIQKTGLGNIAKSAFEVMKSSFDEAKPEIEKVLKARSGSVQLKNVINIGGISSGNSYSGSAIPASITGTSSIRETVDGVEVFTQARTKPVIMDFANVQVSTDRVVVYFEENNRTGSFQLTAEGGLKPFVGYSATKKVEDWKKVTGRAPFTEEFMLDFSLLYSIFVSLMKYDCENDLDTALVSAAVSGAAPYLNPAMVGKVDNADNYGAIGAAVVQMQLANYEPNVLVLNPVDAWIMKLQKGTTGYYVIPPFMFGDKEVSFGRVITSNKVAPGNFFLADATAYQVRLKSIPEFRIGEAADTNDYVRNQMTVIVEKAYFNWIPVNKRPAFIYANFAAVITSIEKP